MSSREIAELLGSRHDNVKSTIERLVERGVIARPAMQDVRETGGNNRAYTTQEYRLDKRSSLIVVAQLSPEFTARVVAGRSLKRRSPARSCPTSAIRKCCSTT